MKLLFLPLLFATAPLDPGLLAPGPQELFSQLDELRERLVEADAIGRAEARIHNQLAAGPAREGSKALCATPQTRSLLARSRAFGGAYRDSVQTVRASGTRLERLLEAPTLQPILRPEQRAEAAELLAQVRDHVRRFREMAAWHARYLEPAARSCKPELVTASGLPGGRAGARDPVAVAAVGGGRLCPAGLPADGRVVVLQDPRACYAASRCDCAPEAVLPGAVLGPVQPEAPAPVPEPLLPPAAPEGAGGSGVEEEPPTPEPVD